MSGGTWDPTPSNLIYRWYRSGSSTAIAAGTSYTLTASDVGRSIFVQATGTRAGYVEAIRSSAMTTTVLAGLPFTSSPAPTITGSAVVGQTLTAAISGWDPTPTTTSYLWFRSGFSSPIGSGSSYTLTSSDLGRTITVQAIGSRAGNIETTRTSSATQVVNSGLPFRSTAVSYTHLTLPTNREV